MIKLSLVEGYCAQPRPAFDEMVGPDGQVRPAWEDLSRVLDQLGPAGLDVTAATASRLLEGDGVVYRAIGDDAAQQWPLDPLPVLLEDAEWGALERGLNQRARLLDALLTDLYRARTVLRRGLLPAETVLAHTGFLRSCDQIRVPGPRQLFTVAMDLARDADGRWVVLHDRAASPSGAGFAMENRRVTSRVLPGLYGDHRINRLGPFFAAMRLGLQEVAPSTAEAPRVVLLSSGPMSETAYDQAFLSQLLGYPLVSGSDLSVREGKVFLRGIDGPEQVDVILRRVDSDFCDPLELRPSSQLGVPGLLEACRLGSVSVVNGLGSGVLENPALLPYLPSLSLALLGEELVLPSAATLWCGDPSSLRQVRERIDELVLKPISRGFSRSSTFGWELSAADRGELLAQIEAEPHLWVGQEAVAASTVPTFERGQVTPRSMVLRTFAVARGGDYEVLSGGLVRVAAERDSVLVSAQAGAIAKDAWVLTSRPHVVPDTWLDAPAAGVRHGVVSPRMAEDLFWLGRYTERAEATTRLLRTVRDRSGDFTQSPEPAGAACLDALLQVLTTVTGTWPGFVGPTGAARREAPRAELLALVVDARRPGTLAHAVQHLTASTHAVRDQLSPDTWLVIGSLEAALRDLEVDSDEVLVGQALTRSLSGLLALAGLSAESMVRDLGWRFLETGRRLERAQQVVALLRAALVEQRPADVDGLVVESVLMAAESIITYRRRYAPRADVSTLLDLLLVDRENPRSVAHQLDRLAGNLAHLPSSEGLRESVERVAVSIRTADVHGLAAAVDGFRRRPQLAVYLGDLGSRLRSLALDVERAYFEDLLAPSSLVEVIA
ncbi:MAG: Protein containing domain [Frankiales bacterium]|nr:Protein containing domain [Frankiales bacterium]